MKTWTSFAIVGALLMTAIPAQAAPDWKQFRPGPDVTTTEELLAAIHAFDPSLDMSQVWAVPVEFSGPLANGVVVRADMLTGRITSEALVGDVQGILAPSPDHGGQPAGCLVAGPQFGYAANPPGVAPLCAFTLHTDGVDNAALACLIVQFCYTLGIDLGITFSLFELFCSIPGGVASTAAPILPPCFAFGFGAPPATWTNWYAYGSQSGLLTAFAWAH